MDENEFDPSGELTPAKDVVQTPELRSLSAVPPVKPDDVAAPTEAEFSDFNPSHVTPTKDIHKEIDQSAHDLYAAYKGGRVDLPQKWVKDLEEKSDAGTKPSDSLMTWLGKVAQLTAMSTPPGLALQAGKLAVSPKAREDAANFIKEDVVGPLKTGANAVADVATAYRDLSLRGLTDPEARARVAKVNNEIVYGIPSGIAGLGEAGYDLATGFANIAQEGTSGAEERRINANVASANMHHDLGKARHEVADFLNVDPDAPVTKTAEFLSQAALPIGVEGKVAPLVAKASDAIVEKAPAVVGRTLQGIGKTGEALTVPAIAAATATAGHPWAAAIELIGGYGGIPWAERCKRAILDKSFGKVSELGSKLASTPDNVTFIGGLRNTALNEAERLKNAEHALRAKYTGKLEHVDDPNFTLDDLSGPDKEIREKMDQAKEFQQRADTMKYWEDWNKVVSAGTKLSLNVAGQSATTGAVVSAITAAQAQPEDVGEASESGFRAGALLGLPGAMTGAPKTMKELRATRNADALAKIGKGAIGDHPDFALHNENINKLKPEAQRRIDILNGMGAPLGVKTILLSPDQILAKSASVEGGEVVKGKSEAPNALIDGKNIYLNSDAGSSPWGHEITHAMEKALGKGAIDTMNTIGARVANPNTSEEYKKFASNYLTAMQKTIADYAPLSNGQITSEAMAEIGRKVLHETPPELFYGGESGGDVVGRWANNVAGKLAPNWYNSLKTDPVFGAPYSKGDVQNVKSMMFDLGEQAAKGKKPSTSPPEPTLPVTDSAVQALTSLGSGKTKMDAATARTRAEAAVADVIAKGEEPTVENVVRQALQRSVPEPEKPPIQGLPQKASVEPPAAPKEIPPVQGPLGAADVHRAIESREIKSPEDFAKFTKGQQLFMPASEIPRETVRQIRDNGGITVNLRGEEPTKGFAFAPSKGTEVKFPMESLNEDHINSYLDSHRQLLEQEGAHIGGWNDGQGQAVLDVSVVHPDKLKALVTARNASQDAIYDLASHQEIRTNEGLQAYSPEEIAAAEQETPPPPQQRPQGDLGGIQAPSGSNGKGNGPLAGLTGFAAGEPPIQRPGFKTGKKRIVLSAQDRNGKWVLEELINVGGGEMGVERLSGGPYPDEAAAKAAAKQFMPAAREAITSPAVQTDDGMIFRGKSYAEAEREAKKFGGKNPVRGFVSRKGFHTQDEASTLGVQTGQLPQGMEESPLTIQGLKDNRKFMPKVSPLGFYSQLEKTIEEKMPNKATAAQILGIISGIKKEEIKWSGIHKFLEEHPNPTKKEVLDHLRESNLTVTEVLKGSGERERFELNREGYQAAHDYLVDEKGWDPNKLLHEYSDNEIVEQANYELETDQMGEAKYGAHVLPGGKNYRELLLTVPGAKGSRDAEWNQFYQSLEKKYGRGFLQSDLTNAEKAKNTELRKAQQDTPSFTDGHFSEPNVVAHVRFNDRYTSADGTSYTPPEKVLHVEEFQSDYAKAARTKGISGKPLELVDELPQGFETRIDPKSGKWQVYDQEGVTMGTPASAATKNDAIIGALGEINRKIRAESNQGVPDAPFIRGSWPNLAMKRMIRYAAENGYDKLTWTTGEQQAARYDLSKQVDAIRVERNDNGTFDVLYRPKRTHEWDTKAGIASAELPEYIGKELAARVQKEVVDVGDRSAIDFEGVDLRIGGEWAKNLYDKTLVNVANDLGKKFGAKVGGTKLNIGMDAPDVGSLPENSGIVHSLPITPEMRESVMKQGQPLFMPSSRPDAVKGPAVKYKDGTIKAMRFHYEFPEKPGQIDGYLLNNGKFLDKKEALAQASKIGQVVNYKPLNPAQSYTESKQLESIAFRDQRKFMPKSDWWDHAQQYLTEEERNSIRSEGIDKIANLFSKLSPEKGSEMALKGEAKRFWYRDSAKEISNIFGPDANRFAGLVASLSPQNSPVGNMRNALNVWAGWLEAGRPTDPAAIKDIIYQEVEQADKTKEKSALPAWVPNAVRALTAEEGIKLSGPKVDSFYNNLVNNVNEVTEDRWMQYYATGTKKPFGARIDKSGRGIKGFSYLALNAHIREVADLLSKQTDSPWTPAEVQAAIWSYIKPLGEKAARLGITPEELMKGEGITEKDILARAQDFRDILQANENKPKLDRIQNAASADFQGLPKRAEQGSSQGLEGSGIEESLRPALPPQTPTLSGIGPNAEAARRVVDTPFMPASVVPTEEKPNRPYKTTLDQLNGHAGEIMAERAALLNYDGFVVTQPNGQPKYFKLNIDEILGGQKQFMPTTVPSELQLSPEKQKAVTDHSSQIRALNNRLQKYANDWKNPEAIKLSDEKLKVFDAIHKLRRGTLRDVVVVGSGPAGTEAAISAGYEGADVVMLEKQARMGGAPKDSSRIENVYGISREGVTGSALTREAIQKARLNGVEIRAGEGMVKLENDPATGVKTITLSNREQIHAKNIVLAPGLSFDRLNVEGGDLTINANGRLLAMNAKGGTAIIVGGGNSASQAAIGAVEGGGVAHILLFARSGLHAMSVPQGEQIEAHPNIKVIKDEIASIKKVDGKLEVATKKGNSYTVDAIGTFLNGRPATQGLPEGISYDEGGRIKTGANLESDIPGIFVAGDAHSGSVPRIASAVGEGSSVASHIVKRLHEE